MRVAALTLAFASIPVATVATMRQDCAAGAADQTFEVNQDTIPIQLSRAFPGVETLLTDLGYELEIADSSTNLLRTVPRAHRPNLTIMERFADFDAPPVQLAVALTATPDSTATVVTHGVLALCSVPGERPAGVDTPIESVFEVAAGAEFTNALFSARDRFESGAIYESTPPRLLSCPTPDFPDYVLAELTTMDIELTFTVSEEGRVDSESLGISQRTSPAVRAVVRDAISACRFRPAMNGGVPVPAPFRYRMVLRRG